MQYFFNPRATYFTTSGRPAALGQLSFYHSGTQTLKAVYDQDGVTPIANPVALDSTGKAPAVKLGTGTYKVVLESYLGQDALDQPVYITEWTVDPYDAASGGGTGGGSAVNIIPDINTLTNSNFSVVGSNVYVMGYYEPGDLGQGWFIWDDTSTAPDDAGSVFNIVNGGATGRWIRQFDTDVVYPQQWGAMFGIPGDTVSSRLLAMFQYADNSALQKTVIFPEQEYPVGGDISFTGAETEVIFKRGAFISRSVAVPTTVTIAVKSLVVPLQNGGIVGTEVDLNITTTDLSDIPVSSWRSASALGMFAKASGNYNANLIIDDDYVIDSGALNVTLDNIHFILGGSIEINPIYTGDITINRYTFEDDLTYIYRNETTQFIFNGETTYQAQHFIPSANNIQDVEYERLLNTVTRSAARSAQIVWDYHATYTFKDAYSASNDFKVEMLVGEASVVIFEWDVFFGKVVNNPGRKIMVATLGAPILTQTIYPQWFGAIRGTSETVASLNVIAMNAAFNTARASSTKIIDMDGIKLIFNDHIEVPATSSEIVLQNGVLETSGTFALGHLIESSNTLKLINLIFDFDAVSVFAVRCITGTYRADNVDMNKGTDLFNTTVGGTVREIHNCTFQFVDAIDIDCLSTQFIDISHNRFVNTPMILNDPANIRVIGNEFTSTTVASNITLQSPGNGAWLNGTWVAVNVIITNNAFLNNGVANYENVSAFNEGMSVGGHRTCEVKDNTYLGNITVKATEIEYRESFAFNTPTVAPTINVDFKDDLILHYTSVPASFGPINAMPISFNWQYEQSDGTGTGFINETNLYIGFSNLLGLYPSKYTVHSTISGAVSFVGNVYVLINTKSNSGSKILQDYVS